MLILREYSCALLYGTPGACDWEGFFFRYSEALEEILYGEVHLCGSSINFQNVYS